MMKKRLSQFALTAAVASVAALVLPSSWAAAGGAWSDTRTSPAIHALNTKVAVRYAAAQDGSELPRGARITQVHASRSYEGSAAVQTSLCWNGTVRCVPLSGPHLNTGAFEGLEADKPLYLVHSVSAWGAQYPPVFVPGNLIVWYETP